MGRSGDHRQYANSILNHAKQRNNLGAFQNQRLDTQPQDGIITAMNTAPDVIESPSNSGFVGSLQHRLLRQFKVQVADWQDTCRELAAWEDDHLVNAMSPERVAEHAIMLDELERVGRWLIAAGNQPGFVDAGTTKQIELTLQDLRDSRAMWHGQTSEKRRQQILRDCFNES